MLDPIVANGIDKSFCRWIQSIQDDHPQKSSNIIIVNLLPLSHKLIAKFPVLHHMAWQFVYVDQFKTKKLVLMSPFTSISSIDSNLSRIVGGSNTLNHSRDGYVQSNYTFPEIFYLGRLSLVTPQLLHSHFYCNGRRVVLASISFLQHLWQ